MKVALCFFGQPRHINNPYTWLSHKYHIIDKYKADVFCHAWISGEEKAFDYADQVKDELKSKENIDAANIILKKYNPKKYIFEKPRQFKLDDSLAPVIKQKQIEYNARIIGSFNWSPNNENNHLSQIYSMSKSISLLNDNYDWVFLTRYDTYIYELPNIYSLEKNNLYLDNQWLTNFSDVMMIGSQPQIEALNCYDNISELCHKIWYFSAEEFKRVAFQSKFGELQLDTFHQGAEKRIPIRTGVVRSNTLDKIQN